MLSKILTSALIAGAVTGLIAALLLFVFVEPVLLHAEMFESGALVHTGVSDAHFDMPPLDVMRTVFLIVFTMFLYSGDGLILVALMNVAESQGAVITARTGLIWGIAGFIAVQFAPGFGLAPEVPGSSAADLTARQLWWFATVGATIGGLWLIAFAKTKMLWTLGAVLILAPHIIGAPEADIMTGTAPTELGGEFAARSYGVGLAAWVMLGSLAGYFWSTERET